VIQLGLDKTSEKDAKALDWESQDNKTMMDETRHFKTIYGTLGDLFDATPMERISKVYFEDKLFETWNHDRTVLIGDGKSKLHDRLCHTLKRIRSPLLTNTRSLPFFLADKIISRTQGGRDGRTPTPASQRLLPPALPQH
jgi:hypothetical protein